MKRNPIIPLIILLIVWPFFLPAQQISETRVDSIVMRTLRAFDVPGIAVGIVKDGRIVLEKGYGVRSLNSRLPVDGNTLFGIASNSKAFTAAALGILVDEGKLKWDDRVIDYIPEFRLYDPYVTREFTVRDLLTHRSGLGLGAGDLMIFPDSSDFTLKDIIYNLRFLKPVSSFRTRFDYDNLLYIVAGEVIQRVTGLSWNDFVESRIMQPLGMTASATNFYRLKDVSNVIDPHAPVNGKVQVIGRDFSTTADPAGGIYSNIHDLSKWVLMQLNHGKYGDNPEIQLFSEAVQQEMWTIQTVLPVRGSTNYNTHFAGYGLGWGLSDVKGYLQASHTGGLAGIVTQITLIPELHLGIIVLTNQQSGPAFTAVTNSIKDHYLGESGIDRVNQMIAVERGNKAEADRITGEVWKAIVAHPSAARKKEITDTYQGSYRDNWFGQVTIQEEGGALRLASKRSPRLKGELFYYKGNTFVVKWDDRSMDADAFVMFNLDENGKAKGFTMKAISPLTDFSYDFQDLDFAKEEKASE